MSDPTTDVLIAGAGPVGLTLAADLARRGVPFRIVDRKPGPETHSKAANFWPRTAEVAAAIGFLEPVREIAVVIRGTTVHAYGSHIGHPRSRPHPRPSPYGEVLAVNQGAVETILARHLAAHGHRVGYGTAVVAVEQGQDAAGVTVMLDGEAGPEAVCARYLVACDGARSRVRDAVGLSVAPIDLPGRGLQQIDARLRWSRGGGHDVISFFLFDDGFCGVVPLPGGYHRVFICRDERDVPDRDPTLDEMQDVLRRIADDPRVELSDPVWFSHGRFRYGVAPAFRAGRVFLAGDAGHITIPIGGQGMNAGIQDAFNLGWKLAAVLQGRATPALLDTYSAERRRVRQELAEDQAANFRRLMHPTGREKLAARWLGPRMMKRGGSVELGERDETQLSIAYHDGPLADDHLGTGGVRAGERAPAAMVVDPVSLEAVPLFREIYGGGWTLLAFDHGAGRRAVDRLVAACRAFALAHAGVRTFVVSADPGAVDWTSADQPVLLDVERYAHEAYEVGRPILFLIRPDGHVAFRGGLRHAESLRAFGVKWLTPGIVREPMPAARADGRGGLASAPAD